MAGNNASGAETHAIKNLDSVQSKGNNDETAETVGRSNGRTAIGSTAGDVGTGVTKEQSAQTMAQLGLDKVQIGEQRIFEGKIDPNKMADLIKQLKEPTEEERRDAHSKLDGQVSKLLSLDYQKTLGDMQKSVLNGDTKAFGETIAKFKDNPQELKAFIDEMNKNLKQSGADTRAEVDSKGNVILHNGGDTGVVFDKNGKATVHEITHRPDGGVVVGGEILGGKSADEVMKEIGNGAIKDISGPKHGSLEQQPGSDRPSWPWGKPVPMPDVPHRPGSNPVPLPEPDWHWEWPRDEGFGGFGRHGHGTKDWGVDRSDDIILLKNGKEQ